MHPSPLTGATSSVSEPVCERSEEVICSKALLMMILSKTSISVQVKKCRAVLADVLEDKGRCAHSSIEIKPYEDLYSNKSGRTA